MNKWHKQTDKPLFPALDWNKPERRDQAGKLLIIGGDIHNLGAPALAYDIVKQTGIGDTRVILPSKARSLLPKELQNEFIFLPSTVSGELSIEGENELLEFTAWADSILLPGDSGRNSQTAILFQNLLATYNERVIITRDAFDLLNNSVDQLLERPRTTLVVSFAQLQKLVKNFNEKIALTFTMDLVKMVEYLQNFTNRVNADIITFHHNQYIAASNGVVSTTKLTQPANQPPTWRVQAASIAACYQTWNPNHPFEALTHTAYFLSQLIK